MRRLIFWLSLALLTFAIGLAIGLVWFFHQKPVIERQSLDASRTPAKQVPAEVLNAPEISYCDLKRSPERFRDTLVRVRASYFVGREYAALYDLTCPGWNNVPCLEFESEEVFTESRQVLAGVASYPEFQFPKRAEVVVVGKLECTNGKGFCHLNSFPCVFNVVRIEAGKEIPASVPWPF